MISVYQDSQPPAPSALKVNKKFEISLANLVSLKQKSNQIIPANLEKIKFLENSLSCSFRLI